MSMVSTRDQVPRLAAAPTIRRAGTAPVAAGLNVRDIVRIVRKRIWLILAVFIVCVAVDAVITGLWAAYAPQYSAKAYLSITPPRAVFFDRGSMYPKEIIDRYRRSMGDMAKNQAVLIEALRDRRITSKSWFANHRDTALKDLDESLRVLVPPERNFIELTMTGVEKTELADIANAVADSFVRFAGNSIRRERDEELTQLNAVATEQKNALQDTLQRISIIRGNRDVAVLEEGISNNTLMMRELQAEITRVEGEQRRVRSQIVAFNENPDWRKNLQMVEMVSNDARVLSLTSQLTELKGRLESSRRRLGDQHQTVIALGSMIESLNQQIEAYQNDLGERKNKALVGTMETELSRITGMLTDLVTAMNLARAKSNDMAADLGNIRALTKSAADIERNMAQINQRILDLRLLTRKAEEGDRTDAVGPVSLLALATEPRDRSQPQWSVMIPVGFMLGLLLGLGVAFLLEFADSSIKTPSDVVRRMDLPLLGTVPHGDDLDEKVEDFRKVTTDFPHSMAAEAFRHLRTNLLFSGPAHERRSLLVTSPAPQDGRTTVVMNLAASMAQAGRKILVVDANFRQPALAGMFPQAAAAGLSSVLVGQAAWRDVISATGVNNLSVMTSGPLPPNPAELLGSQAMTQLISELDAEYDQVLFDGSPLLVVSDCSVLATQVDGVILVVRAHSNSVGIVQRSADQLSRVGARVLGVVLSGVRTTAGGYLRKNYETFYEYQQKPLT